VTGEPGRDVMTLLVEASEWDEALSGHLRDVTRDVTTLRAQIERIAAGTLKADGKLIEDRRLPAGA
jgi:phenylacetate-CoA ligase